MKERAAMSVYRRATMAVCVFGCAALAACSAGDWHFGRSAFPARGVPVAGVDGEPVCFDWREARVGYPTDLLFGNPYPAREQAFGCSIDANLYPQLADPNDLVPGYRSLAPDTGRAQSGAMERYYSGKVRPLPDRKSTIGSMD